MTRETKEEKAGFLFQTVDRFLNERINLVLGELKQNSNLDKETIANLLLEVLMLILFCKIYLSSHIN